MARNSEKAMTALARWRAEYVDKKDNERRPFLATECDDLEKAKKFRRQIISEVSKKVAQIQNAGLGEFKLRDLNDEINKLLREKWHWENRIIELGGPNFKKHGAKMLDSQGREVPGDRGYKYFGAAKDLPGVRELFNTAPPEKPKRTRAELMRGIDADYYGYRDEDDGVLVPLELAAERAAVARLVDEWRVRKESAALGDDVGGEGGSAGGGGAAAADEDEKDIYAVESDEEGTTGATVDAEGPSTRFKAHVPDIPSQKQIEEALLRRKKAELLEKYASSVLRAEAEEAKTLMGYQP